MHWGLDGSRYMSLSAFFLCLLSCLEALTSYGLILILSGREEGKILASVESEESEGCGKEGKSDREEREEGMTQDGVESQEGEV